MVDLFELGEGISIHTPLRGVTVIEKHVGTQEVISIHTPLRGVTKK